MKNKMSNRIYHVTLKLGNISFRFNYDEVASFEDTGTRLIVTMTNGEITNIPIDNILYWYCADEKFN